MFFSEETKEREEVSFLFFLFFHLTEDFVCVCVCCADMRVSDTCAFDSFEASASPRKRRAMEPSPRSQLSEVRSQTKKEKTTKQKKRKNTKKKHRRKEPVCGRGKKEARQRLLLSFSVHLSSPVVFVFFFCPLSVFFCL